MKVFFASGVATFHVPEEAQGFTVDTADADVVDLGTAFGIKTGGDGRTEVAVFEGEVEVRGKLVKEGQAVRAAKLRTLKTARSTHRLFKRLASDLGVLQTTGRMLLCFAGGFRPGKYEDDGHMTVFLEKGRPRLPSPLPLDLADPGEFRKLRREEGQFWRRDPL